MGNFEEIIERGERQPWGISSTIRKGRKIYVSNELLLQGELRTGIGSLLRRVESFCKKPLNKKPHSSFSKNKILGSGGESTVYEVQIGSNIAAALKVYDEDKGEGRGRTYFRTLLKAKAANIFDTLTPYLATKDYILTDLIPPYPEFDDFVQEHPEAEKDATEALLNILIGTRLQDVGFNREVNSNTDREQFLTDRMLKKQPMEFEVKHVHVAKFTPDEKSLQKRFRFYIYDMLGMKT